MALIPSEAHNTNASSQSFNRLIVVIIHTSGFNANNTSLAFSFGEIRTPLFSLPIISPIS